MTNGFHALKGFEYQATVTLDVLLEHFHGGAAVEARPEGQDDLVLRPASGRGPLQYVQIKKPREWDNGQLKHEAWSLNDAVRELFPGTVKRLQNNSHRQLWILGDDIEADLKTLCLSRERAPSDHSCSYLTVLHRIIRNCTSLTTKNGQPDASGKNSLERWRYVPPAGVLALYLN